MATAATPSFHSTKETTNYARLCKLLVAVSEHVLRETFDKKRPPGNLDTVLSSPPIHRVLKSLRIKKILNPSQWDKLYPAIKSSVSSKNFDITLLNVLLRTICGLAPPATGWNTLPLAADTTLVADVVRIKCYRNIVYSHTSGASVHDATFNQYWQDIQDALVRLGGAGYQSAIDDLKYEFMDPDFEEHHKELLKQRVVYEVSIKERLETELLKEAIANPPKKFKAGDKEDESEWSRITTLSLSDQNVANFVSLCQALQTPTCKVTQLNLYGNQITGAGVASLCQALQTPTCKVTQLDLGYNQITDADVASLCQVLQTPTCEVTQLDLGYNQITDAGVASLCQALQTPTCKVTKLDLALNQFTDAGVASLCQALQTPICKVIEICLGDNQITDAGVASLCQALQTPTCKVTILHVGGNQITDAGVASLCQALQTPTCKVTQLYLVGNQITDAGVASLCQALQTPTCKVTQLDLNDNQITEAAEKRLMYNV